MVLFLYQICFSGVRIKNLRKRLLFPYTHGGMSREPGEAPKPRTSVNHTKVRIIVGLESNTPYDTQPEGAHCSVSSSQLNAPDLASK